MSHTDPSPSFDPLVIIKGRLTLPPVWNSPYSFFNSVYNAKDEDLNIVHTISGSLGTLIGLW